MLLVTLVCVGMQWSAGPVSASALADGTRAFADGDFVTASRLWRPLAAAGDADAQFALGTLYQSGKGVEQSDERATAWFRRAAVQGSVPAQFNLGNAYKHGRGVQASDTAAFHWWRKAAEAGLAPAQFNVGTAYFHGRGVERSGELGAVWDRRAAANGHPGARAALVRLAMPDVSRAAEDLPRVLDPSWIRGQPPRHFTIQLLAAQSEPAARRFVASLPSGDYALCPYRSQDKRWVGVVTGSYASAAAAHQAAESWRERGKPWIRSFADLKADMIE